MRKIHRTIVAALIISKDGKLLMGMKDPKKGGVYSDCWHIPGGGIEDREDELTALKRELIEEVGINISEQKVQLVDYAGSGESEKTLSDGEKVLCEMSFHVYRVDLNELANQIKIKLNDDLVKTEWTDLSKLKDFKLTPPSIKLFTRLGWLAKA